MILKGSQRGGARQLAAHLLNMIDNDHVELQQLRGFIASDLEGALDEAHAISKATKCKQFMFSLSINPPKEANASLEAILHAADRAEEKLGLSGQPRGIVVHEKEGRRHAHVVWSRIDAGEMKAINLPHFKSRLAGLSKELYLEHGWTLPEGHRENGWKNPLNFTLNEWQQAKRLQLDPREVKQLFQEAWQVSDSGRGFKAALEERGYFLAAGDRRGFVAVDLQGEVYSLSRMTGANPKELQARLGSPDQLLGVEDTRREVGRKVSSKVRDYLRTSRKELKARLQPLEQEKSQMVHAQRLEREKLRNLQNERLIRENRERQARMRRGVMGVWDILTGRAGMIRRENEREAFAGLRRDQQQRERVFDAQQVDRRALQVRMDRVREGQRAILMQMAGLVGKAARVPEAAKTQQAKPARKPQWQRERDYDNDLDFGL